MSEEEFPGQPAPPKAEQEAAPDDIYRVPLANETRTFEPRALSVHERADYGNIDMTGMSTLAEIKAGDLYYVVVRNDTNPDLPDAQKPHAIMIATDATPPGEEQRQFQVRGGMPLSADVPHTFGRTQEGDMPIVKDIEPELFKNTSRNHGVIALESDGKLTITDHNNSYHTQVNVFEQSDEGLDPDRTIPRSELNRLRGTLLNKPQPAAESSRLKGTLLSGSQPAVEPDRLRGTLLDGSQPAAEVPPAEETFKEVTEDPLEALEAANPSVEVAEVVEEAGVVAVGKTVEPPPAEEPAPAESQEPERPAFEEVDLNKAFMSPESLEEVMRNDRTNPELRSQLSHLIAEWHQLEKAGALQEVWQDLITPRLDKISEAVPTIRQDVTNLEPAISQLTKTLQDLNTAFQYHEGIERVGDILRGVQPFGATKEQLKTASKKLTDAEGGLDTLRHGLAADELMADERYKKVVRSEADRTVDEDMLDTFRAYLADGLDLRGMQETLQTQAAERRGPRWQQQMEVIQEVATFARIFGGSNGDFIDNSNRLQNGLDMLMSDTQRGGLDALARADLLSYANRSDRLHNELTELDRILIRLGEASKVTPTEG